MMNKLDCEEYFAMYQKERKRKSFSCVFPLKERDQDLMEDFKQTDVDNAPRLSAAIFKIGFNL